MIRMFAARLVAAIGMVAAVAATASAQTPEQGFAQFFVQSAFGNVTSQAFGGEAGVSVGTFQVIVEGGLIRDVATTEISTAAAAIASALTQLQPSAVSYSVKQPVSFGAIGIRYPFMVQGSKVRPYVQAGAGLARVKNDVSFTIASGASLEQFVTLGDDLTGSHTDAMLTFGGGVVVPVWQQMILDLQFRYGRIFAEGKGINVGRAGIGVGVHF